MKRQFLIFTVVGVAASLTTYVVLIVLVEIFQLGLVFSSVAGYLTGACVNYLMNYRFTFSSSRFHRATVPRFMVVMSVALVLNTMIMLLATNWFSLHYLLAQLLAVAVVMIWSFALNRLWAFGCPGFAT